MADKAKEKAQQVKEVTDEVLKAVWEAKEDVKFSNLLYERQHQFNKRVIQQLASVTPEVS